MARSAGAYQAADFEAEGLSTLGRLNGNPGKLRHLEVGELLGQGLEFCFVG
jgi:hypothetical protein